MPVFYVVCSSNNTTGSSFFQIIEKYPVTVGLVAALLGSIFGIRWAYARRQEKRLEAHYSFYANLLLHIINLKSTLNEMRQISIIMNSGNIFVLSYTNDIIREIFSAFSTPTDDELNRLRFMAKPLQELLLTSKNNINPKKSDLEEWYNSQIEISSFLFLLINGFTKTITKYENDNPYHIEKCNALINSMDYLINTLKKELRIKKCDNNIRKTLVRFLAESEAGIVECELVEHTLARLKNENTEVTKRNIKRVLYNKKTTDRVSWERSEDGKKVYKIKIRSTDTDD